MLKEKGQRCRRMHKLEKKLHFMYMNIYYT